MVFVYVGNTYEPGCVSTPDFHAKSHERKCHRLRILWQTKIREVIWKLARGGGGKILNPKNIPIGASDEHDSTCAAFLWAWRTFSIPITWSLDLYRRFSSGVWRSNNHENCTFYHVFGASTTPSRVSISCQKVSSLRFSLVKFFSVGHMGSK